MAVRDSLRTLSIQGSPENADILYMKRSCAVLLVSFFSVSFAAAQTEEIPSGSVFRQEGIASWYGAEFDGRPTASGEIFNSTLFTAAHPTLPFGTMLAVTNRQNNRRVTVRVNDRGPFVPARIIDVSRAAAEQLDMISTGTAPVLVEGLEPLINSRVQPPPERSGAEAVSVPQSQGSGQNYQTPGQLPQDNRTVQTPRTQSLRLIPAISPENSRVYRLQVGSYRVPRNAVEAFEKLKNAGLNPAYERNGEYFRVVLAGIRAEDIAVVSEKIWTAGFGEALIREER
jgi:rare lipoprotein A